FVDRLLPVDLGAFADAAGDLDDILRAQHVAGGGGFRVFLGPEDALRHALAVAHVDENDAVVVPDGIDPPRQRGGAADVGFAEFVAMVGAVHVDTMANTVKKPPVPATAETLPSIFREASGQDGLLRTDGIRFTSTQARQEMKFAL